MSELSTALENINERRAGADKQRLADALRDLKLIAFPDLAHDRYMGLMGLIDAPQFRGWSGGARLHLMRAGKSLALALRQGMPEAADGMTIAAIAAIVRAAESLPEEPPAEEPATL